MMEPRFTGCTQRQIPSRTDRSEVGAEAHAHLWPSLQLNAMGTQFALTTAVPQYATRDTRHCDPA